MLEIIKQIFTNPKVLFRETPRILFPEKRLSWLDLNKKKWLKILQNKGCIGIEFCEQSKEEYLYKIDIDKTNYKNTNYRGVNLYSALLYDICVEAEVFATAVDYGDLKHKEIINKIFMKGAAYIDYISKLIIDTKPNAFVNLHGNILESSIIRAIALQKNIPGLTLENTLNKTKILWNYDKGYVNSCSNLGMIFYNNYKDLVSSRKAKRYVKKYFNNICSMKSGQHISGNEIVTIKNKKPTIVFLGQVYTDSSVLFGLYPGFKTPEALISALVDYALSMECNIIIKMHPKEFLGCNPVNSKRYDELTWRKINSDSLLMEKIHKYDSIYIDHKNALDTLSLIDIADVVVTINSQAGLEALARGKETILCGMSFYEDLGTTFNASNFDMLAHFLKLVLIKKESLIDHDKICKFFYIYFEKYCCRKGEVDLFNLLKNRLLQN